jgi:hypothetical protein
MSRTVDSKNQIDSKNQNLESTQKKLIHFSTQRAMSSSSSSSSSSFEEYAPEVLTKLRKRGREDLSIFLGDGDELAAKLVEADTVPQAYTLAHEVAQKRRTINQSMLFSLVADVFEDLSYNPKYEAEEEEDDSIDEGELATEEELDPLPDLPPNATVWTPILPNETLEEVWGDMLPDIEPEEVAWCCGKQYWAPASAEGLTRRMPIRVIELDGEKLVPWHPCLGPRDTLYGVVVNTHLHQAQRITVGKSDYIPVKSTAVPTHIARVEPNKFIKC